MVDEVSRNPLQKLHFDLEMNSGGKEANDYFLPLFFTFGLSIFLFIYLFIYFYLYHSTSFFLSVSLFFFVSLSLYLSIQRLCSASSLNSCHLIMRSLSSSLSRHFILTHFIAPILITTTYPLISFHFISSLITYPLVTTSQLSSHIPSSPHYHHHISPQSFLSSHHRRRVRNEATREISRENYVTTKSGIRRGRGRHHQGQPEHARWRRGDREGNREKDREIERLTDRLIDR